MASQWPRRANCTNKNNNWSNQIQLFQSISTRHFNKFGENLVVYLVHHYIFRYCILLHFIAFLIKKKHFHSIQTEIKTAAKMVLVQKYFCFELLTTGLIIGWLGLAEALTSTISGIILLDNVDTYFDPTMFPDIDQKTARSRKNHHNVQMLHIYNPIIIRFYHFSIHQYRGHRSCNEYFECIVVRIAHRRHS